MDTAAATPPACLEWRLADALVPYPAAIDLMRERVAAIRAGSADEMAWLVEHPPLYTAGTSARPEHLAEPDRFPTFDAGRGGQWTYHGPGQRVVYLMLDLQRSHGAVRPRDTHAYVEALETWLIRCLAEFGVTGERRRGRVGIWVRTGATEAKIAAIGVRVTRWVSWHGVAVNVSPALEHFGGIVPCGIREHGVTSLAALGISARLAEVDAALRASYSTVFGPTRFSTA